MTPELLEEGARRAKNTQLRADAAAQGKTESGGREAGFSRRGTHPAKWTSPTAAFCTWKM
jgi:hypothetical protein